MCEIIPKKILKKIAENDPNENRRAYFQNIVERKEDEFRRKRKQISQNLLKGVEPDVDRSHTEHLKIYDNKQEWDFITKYLWEELIQKEHSTLPKPRRIFTKDLDKIFDFFHDLLCRESIDNKNMTVISFLNYGQKYPNAFWTGTELVFGKGDRIYFNDFSKCYDVVVHEMIHGTTQWEANLDYELESGALNESISDVFGICAYQHKYNLPVDKSNWIIGEKLFTKRVNAKGLRSFKDELAYDDKIIGTDDAPKYMKDYQSLPNTEDGDWGGVHSNSQIYNHLFYVYNTKLGGNTKTWENGSMNIWYNALLKENGLSHNATFTDFARKLIEQANKLHGNESPNVEKLKESLDFIGIKF